jgi:hypothetical protein
MCNKGEVGDAEQCSECDRTDLRLLFETCIADIKFVKNQQWKTVYLTLLALGGILALSLKRAEMGRHLNLLAFVNIIVALVGCVYIIEQHYSLAKFRGHKVEIVGKLGACFQKLHGKQGCFCYLRAFFSRDLFFFALPFCALIAAAAILNWRLIFGC